MMAFSKTVSTDKGGQAEEALRQYFKELGSFVLRGIPVREGTESVSDIDLWVYTRSSPLSRHIAIVDIKNKKRGKAFERAVWVKGLQVAMKADDAIIASQGAKDAVYSFAARLEVRVLSSSVFDAILKRYSHSSERIPLEELEQSWKSVSLGSDNLKARMDSSRAEISRGISFSSLNAWIDQAGELLGHVVDRERQTPGPLTRAFYYCCALLAVGADYLGREHALSDNTMRREHYREGLLYGRTDGSSGKSYLDFAQSLATEFFDPSGAAAAQMRKGFEGAVSSLPIEGLVDLFSKPNAGSELMKAATVLEAAAFAATPVRAFDLQGVEAKSIVGLVSDYAGHRRSDVLGTKDSKSTGPAASTSPRIESGGGQGTLPI